MAPELKVQHKEMLVRAEELLPVVHQISAGNLDTPLNYVVYLLLSAFSQYGYHLAHLFERAPEAVFLWIGYSAWISRGILELCVWLKYAMKSDANSSRIISDLVIDYEDAANSFSKSSGTSPETIQAMKSALLSLRSEMPYAPSGGYLNSSAMAKDLGLQPEFGISNKVLSKLLHPTAMSITMILMPQKHEQLVDSFALKAIQGSVEFLDDLEQYVYASQA